MENSAGPSEVAASPELLWGPHEPSQRGPRPAFTLAQVADTAVRLADRGGIATVSMQRVASELGYTKMALYRYVPGKSELLAIMVETAIGPPPDMRSVRGGWRRRARTWTQLMWATWDRHPWLPGVTTGSRAIGPNETGWTEAGLSAFDATPLSGSQRMSAVSLLSGHIRNTYSAAAAGTQPWTPAGRLDPGLAPFINAARDSFPAITAALGSPGRRTDPREFGLRCILDGIEQLITPAGRPADRARRSPAPT
ncbi:MAG: TetR/AcrR family transcriptional regulator [Nocardiopsaceae bacterium]|jgi:AcrR family transcriptional regulator|nr:TetR/AcrR family transcriptional regulator [Nocardiopsaceae bacterium]